MNEKWHPKFGMTLMFVYIIYKLLVGCILQSFLLQLLYGLLTFGHLNVDSFFSSNDIGIQFQLFFEIWNIFVKDYNPMIQCIKGFMFDMAIGKSPKTERINLIEKNEII